jgi:hypothetical protein
MSWAIRRTGARQVDVSGVESAPVSKTRTCGRCLYHCAHGRAGVRNSLFNEMQKWQTIFQQLYGPDENGRFGDTAGGLSQT